MKEVSYHESLLLALEGKKIILLPKNANPYYLAIGVQKYNPCAVCLEQRKTYTEQQEEYAICKEAVLSAFSSEPDVSHSKITAWEV